MQEQKSEQEGGRRSLWAAVFANAGIAVAKIVAYLFTGSTSMLGEAAHSLADTSKQILLFTGRVRARRRADPEHPFGYGPDRYFWALLVAIVLFPLGAAYSIFESVSKLQDPEPIRHPAWAIGTLVAAMLFEGLSLRVAVHEARRAGGETSLWRYIRRTRDPDIASVLLEDAGALVGLSFALLAIGLSLLTGDPRFDAGGGLAIAALLLVIAGILSVEFRSLLIGESATPEMLESLRTVIRTEPRLRRIIYLRTLHLSPQELLVAAKVELDPKLKFQEVVDTIDAIEERVYESLPEVRVLHIEPDVYEPEVRPKPSWDETPGD